MVDFRKALVEWRASKLSNLTNEGDYKMALDANKLSRLSAMWAVAIPQVPSFSNVPDGDYVGDMKEMVLGESKAGRMQVVITFEVADGEYAGKTLKSFDGVEEETGMGYFKHKSEVIGLDLPEHMLDWQAKMDAFIGDPTRLDLYDLTVKTSKGKEGQEYSNVYLNSVSEFTKGEGEAVAATEEEEAATEEAATEAAEEQTTEVEVQEIQVPTRRVLAKPKVLAAPAKVAAPVRQVVAQPKVAAQPIRRMATPAPKVVAQPARKIVSLVRK